jgi:tetratricopeptide (TPR) repeat protein
MLRDHGVIEGETVGETSGVPMPASVHQLIGARIDTLPPAEKGVLQDAAIVGKVFWSGAVEAVSGLPEDVVIRALEESVRREFVHEVPDSAFRGQQEYAFDHLLVQEVCYRQIPRAARADRHVAAARWIRAVAADRVFELAELLAHHYGEALAFTKATDPDRNVAGLEAATGAALMMAADRAKRIDASKAVELYRRARAVLREDDPERRRALIESAEAAEEAGRLDEANAAFDAAISECREAGDRLGLGEALARRARSSQEHSAGARSLLEEAIALLEEEEPGAELARAYTRMAGHLYVSGSNDAAIEWSDRALALADELGVEAESVLALQYRGAARSQAGDVTGLEDLRAALTRGLELGLGDEVATAYNNLAYEVWFWQGPAAAKAIWEEMAAFCHVRGFATGETWADSGKLETLFDLGEWDEAFELATSLREWGRARGFRRVDMIAAVYRAWVWLRRGEADAAGREVDALLPEARQIGYGEFLAPALVIASEVALVHGDVGQARILVAEFVRNAKANPEFWRVFLPVAVRVVVALGDVVAAGELMTMTGERFPVRMRLSTDSAIAILEEARGDVAAAAERYRRSAEGWEAYGFVLEEARTRMGLGRCMAALGRTDEGRRELERARALLEPMGARPMLEEVDRVLAGAGASTG